MSKPKRFGDHWLWRHLPAAETIRQNRMLQPLARFLDHHALWQFNRRSVAGGLAVGLFFSIAVPAMQIPFAAAFAILFRVNIPVAALATFLSNPFTTPFIIYLAYQIGMLLTGQAVSMAAHVAYEQLFTEREMSFDGMITWLSDAVSWAQAAGLPLLVGLVTIGAVLAVIGYFGTNLIWRLHTQSRWRMRMERRRQQAGKAGR